MPQFPMTMRAAEYRTSLSGKSIPYVRNEQGVLVPVSAAALSDAQLAYLCAPEPEIIGVGPRGCGKSEAILLDFLSGVGRGWGRAYSGILFRESQPQLRDLIKLAEELIRPIWPNCQYHKLEKYFEWKSGETLEFRHYELIEDFKDIQGRQFAFIGWEEITNFHDLEGYLKSFSSLRSIVPGMPRKMRSTGNPLGTNHNKVKHRFHLSGIPQGIAGPVIVDGDGTDNKSTLKRRAIHFTFDSNVLMRRHDPHYVQNLNINDDPNILLAWVKGSWDAISGGAFDWVFLQHGDTIKVPRFEVPLNWRMFYALDYGTTSPSSCGFYAIANGDDFQMPNGKWISSVPGDVYRVGEVYTCPGDDWSRGEPELTISGLVARIQNYKVQRRWLYPDLTRPGKWIDRCSKGVADNQLWATQPDHADLIEQFAHKVTVGGVTFSGLNLEKADKGYNDRLVGFRLMCNMLVATGDRPRRNPGLFIVEDDCPAFLATVPALQRDPKNTECIADRQVDHCFDECRYALRFDHKPSFTSGRVGGV